MAHVPIDVLIIGAGMHVSGRGTSGYGTVLPAVIQTHRDGLVGRVLVAATSPASIRAVHEKMAGLNSLDLESLRPTFRQALRSTAVVEAVNQSLGSKSEWVPVRSSE
jgi:hypothetical protein